MHANHVQVSRKKHENLHNIAKKPILFYIFKKWDYVQYLLENKDDNKEERRNFYLFIMLGWVLYNLSLMAHLDGLIKKIKVKG